MKYLEEITHGKRDNLSGLASLDTYGSAITSSRVHVCWGVWSQKPELVTTVHGTRVCTNEDIVSDLQAQFHPTGPNNGEVYGESRCHEFSLMGPDKVRPDLEVISNGEITRR